MKALNRHCIFIPLSTISSVAVAAHPHIANMASAGRGVAKVLGINLDYRKEELENSGAASISSVETCMLLPANPSSPS